MLKVSALVALVSVLALSGCAKKADVIISSSDEVHITDADIDKDPVALLPAGAIGIVHVDAQSLYQSQFGPTLQQITASRLPVPPSAGFDPSRDLGAVFFGVYSMQGADVAGVATGTFDPGAIERAADGTTITPLGAPLVKTTYSGRTLYVSRNTGFSVLTTHTVLFGDETGIRRALDRLAQGQAKHDIPGWVDDVLRTPNAPMAAAFDFAGQAPAEAAVRNLPFLQGIRTARVVGNFQPPGMNFAGTLSYPDPQTAAAAAASIQQTNQTLHSSVYSFAMQLAGLGNPIQNLQTTPSGNDTQLVVGVDSRAITWALGQAITRMGSVGQGTGP